MLNHVKIDDRPEEFMLSVNGKRIEHVTEYSVKRTAGRESLVTITICADKLDINQSPQKEKRIGIFQQET